MTDIHTHNTQAIDAIISIGPSSELEAGRFYSIGIHPWQATPDSSVSEIASVAASGQVVAIGETGLDRLKGPSLEIQQRLFEDHIALSERLRKPLIIHSVRTADLILALHRRLRPTQPWIIHGFRGKPALARQLLSAGIYLSLGPRFNAETARAIPADRLLIETDDDPSATLTTVAAAVAAARSTTADDVLTLASANLINIFF